MHIGVIGHTGLLGRAVCQEAERQNIRICSIRTPIETITSRELTLYPYALTYPLTCIINCAGIIKQRIVTGRSTPAEMLDANAVGPWVLAEACHVFGIRMIHVSTDCVFNGPGPHSEDGIPDAQDLYALSKRVGEVTDNHVCIVRTSFIGRGGGLVEELHTQQSVRASDRLLWSGHTVETVTRILLALADNPIHGIVHIPGTYQSRYQLATTIATWLHRPHVVIRDDSFVADRRLASMRWCETGLPEPPPFDEQFAEWGTYE